MCLFKKTIFLSKPRRSKPGIVFLQPEFSLRSAWPYISKHCTPNPRNMNRFLFFIKNLKFKRAMFPRHDLYVFSFLFFHERLCTRRGGIYYGTSFAPSSFLFFCPTRILLLLCPITPCKLPSCRGSLGRVPRCQGTAGPDPASEARDAPHASCSGPFLRKCYLNAKHFGTCRQDLTVHTVLSERTPCPSGVWSDCSV